MWGAILAGLSVILGAFGAHALKPLLEQKYLDIYETAVRYQFYHSLALILFGLTCNFKEQPKIILTLFICGIIIFSGSLYGIVFGSLFESYPLNWLGAITPLGGISLILSWFIFAYNIVKK